MSLIQHSGFWPSLSRSLNPDSVAGTYNCIAHVMLTVCNLKFSFYPFYFCKTFGGLPWNCCCLLRESSAGFIFSSRKELFITHVPRMEANDLNFCNFGYLCELQCWKSMCESGFPFFFF